MTNAFDVISVISHPSLPHITHRNDRNTWEYPPTPFAIRMQP